MSLDGYQANVSKLRVFSSNAHSLIQSHPRSGFLLSTIFIMFGVASIVGGALLASPMLFPIALGCICVLVGFIIFLIIWGKSVKKEKTDPIVCPPISVPFREDQDPVIRPLISIPFREDQDPILVFPEKLSDSDKQNLSALTEIVKSRMQREFIVPNDLKKTLLKVRFSQDKTKLFRDNGILKRINNNGRNAVFQVEGYPDFVCKTLPKRVQKNSLKEDYEELIKSKALCEFLNLDLIQIPNVQMIEVSSNGEVYDVMVMEKINFKHTLPPRVYTCASTLIQLTAFGLFSGYWDFDANNVVHTGLKIGEGPTVAVIDFDKFREHSPYYGLTKLIPGVYSKKNLQSIKNLVDRIEIEMPLESEANETWKSFNSKDYFNLRWSQAMEN